MDIETRTANAVNKAMGKILGGTQKDGARWFESASDRLRAMTNAELVSAVMDESIPTSAALKTFREWAVLEMCTRLDPGWENKEHYGNVEIIQSLGWRS